MRAREQLYRGGGLTNERADTSRITQLVQALEQAAQHNPDETQQALKQLCDLTVWQSSNQRKACELGAAGLVFSLLPAFVRAIPPSSAGRHQNLSLSSSATAGSEAAKQPAGEVLAVLALRLIIQLSSNEDQVNHIGEVPGCASTLVALANITQHPPPLVVHAARCLINLTHSNHAVLKEAEQVHLSASHLLCV
jgi:hypothetical protein